MRAIGQHGRNPVSRSGAATPIRWAGVFHVEQFRKGRLIKEFDAPNAVTDVGANLLLNVMFHGTAASATWYLGLIQSDNYSALAAADTIDSHAGWEECTSYDEAARMEWTEGAANARAITNAAQISFTISATKTVKGLFLINDSTKGGAVNGTLFSTALFTGGDASVIDNDVLKVTYTVSL